MVSFGDAIKAQSRVVMCNLLGGPYSVPYLGGTPNPDINSLQKRINGARKYFCNESDEIQPEDIVFEDQPELPYSGGQCFTDYSVTWAIEATRNDGQKVIVNSGTAIVPGPVEQFTQLIENPPYFPVGTVYVFRVLDRNGNAGGRGTNVNVSDTPGGADSVVSTRWKTFEVTRLDGQPDNCGSQPIPPPVIPPYIPTPIIVNIEYEDGDNITINEDVTFNIFAPIVLVGGAIIAPITVTGNDFSLVGEMQLNGELNVEFKPEFNFGPRGQVDTEPPDPDAPYPQPERPEGSRSIVGAIVTATTVSSRPATQIGQDGNPDIFAPRVGNLAFYIATDKGSAWTSDIPIKNVRQYVPCPSSFGAVDVAATAEPGWALNVEPVWDYPGLP